MEILKIIETLQSYSEDVVAYKLDRAFAHAVSEAVALLVAQGEKIAELEEQNRWIPVTEGLPKEGQRVIARCKSIVPYLESYRICDLLFFTVNGKPIWDNLHFEVTHWMPEPPKEG